MKKKVIATISSIFVFIFIYNATVFTLIEIHSFLAVTSPVDAEVLVVEGWLFDYMLNEAAEEIQTGKYKYIVTTGIDKYMSQETPSKGLINTAETCKDKLIQRGIHASTIYPVASSHVDGQYTLFTATAIKSWLVQRNIKAVNVFTGGPHGRKSLVIFQKALGKDIQVGVITCKAKHYPPVYWWTSLTGAKATLRYLAGYLYALSLNDQ